jgi:hypothetical protein
MEATRVAAMRSHAQRKKMKMIDDDDEISRSVEDLRLF